MKPYYFLGILALLIMSCNENTPVDTTQSFYIGTYTKAESKGIYKADFNADGQFKNLKVMALSENPSFLAYTKDQKFLVAVNESTKEGESNGSISSFRIENDSLVFVDKMHSHGNNPCHVTITEDNYVITSNYMGGNVVLSKLDENGKLSYLDTNQHMGGSDHPRQEAAHVHSTWIHPETNDVIAVDLGTNDLWFYQIDRSKNTLIQKEQQKLAMDSIAGPRHLTFHPKNPNWLYVLNELDYSVSLVTYEDGKYAVKSTTDILFEAPEGYNASADIHISKDGKFLYASHRGYNTIAVLEINTNDGALKLIDVHEIPGSWPRNFSLSPDQEYLIYANEWTNNIFSLKRDTENGTLTLTDSIQVPNPVMILF
jgi:6-phosphogluconolactonase